MSCERYWREGIVLVERGLDDPHREGCEDCLRAHASRQELIDALPAIGAGATGDPFWQAQVWQRLREDRPRAAARWQRQLAGVLAVACAIALWIVLGRARTGDDARATLEIIERGVAMRSRAPQVDDLLRVTAREGADVWIYRADRLVLACRPRAASPGCAADRRGMVAELLLSAPATYRVFVVEVPPSFAPRGALDADRATLESAGLDYEEHRVSVR